MSRKLTSLLTLCAVVALVVPAAASAATLKDDPPTIFYSAGHYLAGEPIRPGFDPFGYNYQAHIFSGSYFNSYAGGAGYPPYEGDDDAYLAANPSAADHWAWPYRGIHLSMKWNEMWISKEDNDGDGKLDRHLGHGSYLGSGAWLTNHMSGSYTVEVNGRPKEAHWTYFTKIVAAPTTAVAADGLWYDDTGIEIGPAIWGQFATIQEVENDPFAGIHGRQYGSPVGPGFGQFGPE